MSNKILIVGDKSVGKTSIIKGYGFDKFGVVMATTDSVNCHSVKLNGIKLSVLEISSLKRSGHMKLAYYQHVKAAVIVIGADCAHNIQDYVLKWKSDVESILRYTIPILVLVSKIDLCQCDISSEYITTQLLSIGVHDWLKTSAKNQTNIKNVFNWLEEELPGFGNRLSEKYVEQCIKNIESLIYDIDAHATGSWVYDVVLPRIDGCKSNYTHTLTAVMTNAQYSQFEMALQVNDFIIKETIRESEVIQERVSLKISDSDNLKILTIRIIIVKKLNDLKDVEVAQLKAHRNKFEEDAVRVDQLRIYWMEKVTFLNKDTFNQLSNVSTFAKRINNEYLSRGWTIGLDKCEGDKIKFDETKEILYVEESLEKKLDRYENKIKELEEVNGQLMKQVCLFGNLLQQTTEFSEALKLTAETIKTNK